MILAQVYLEREEQTQKVFRFYHVKVNLNLFGDIQLDISWGRIGKIGGTSSMIYSDAHEATAVLARLRARQEARGYTTLIYEEASTPVVNLIPRRLYPILDMNLSQLFNNEQILFNVAEEMRNVGVIFTGEFVQLTPSQIVAPLARKSQTKRRVVDHTCAILKAVSSRLSEFDLRLDARVPGWCAPSISNPSPSSLGVFLP